VVRALIVSVAARLVASVTASRQAAEVGVAARTSTDEDSTKATVSAMAPRGHGSL
jgi:hypothetical protein